MTATVTFLIYRIEWHRRRATAMRAARGGMPVQRAPCRIYWAEDAFGRPRSEASPNGPERWRGPCKSNDLQTDSD